jgi:hypothetical protein
MVAHDDASSRRLKIVVPLKPPVKGERDKSDVDTVGDASTGAWAHHRFAPSRAPVIVGIVVVVALAGLGGWLTYRRRANRQDQRSAMTSRSAFLVSDCTGRWPVMGGAIGAANR